MSIRKLLLFFFVCALMAPVSNAAQAAKSAAAKGPYEKGSQGLQWTAVPQWHPSPYQLRRRAGFDVSGPKYTNGE